MKSIVLINMAASMLVEVAFFYRIYRGNLENVKRIFKTEQLTDPQKAEEEIEKADDHVREILFLLMSEAIILTAGYVFLFWLQSIPQLSPVNATGLVTPILLLIYGLVINGIYRGHVKKTKRAQLGIGEIEEITVWVSVMILVSLAFFNWRLSLFILSVVLGKYIWIDFAFGEGSIGTKCKYLIGYLKEGSQRARKAFFIFRVFFLQYCFTYVITVSLNILFYKTGWPVLDMILCMAVIYLTVMIFHSIALDSFGKTGDIKNHSERHH